MQHAEVQIFNLQPLIAVEICNNFGGIQAETLQLKVEIKFT